MPTPLLQLDDVPKPAFFAQTYYVMIFKGVEGFVRFDNRGHTCVPSRPDAAGGGIQQNA